MSLNEKQQEALQAVVEGKNIFLTGPGGVGKSYLVRRILETLTERGKKVGVTALTGCAALLLGHGAKTIHSWAGIGLGRDSAQTITANIKKYNPKAIRRWILSNTLIIDEVSMLTPEILEKLNTIGMTLRKNPSKPFGGLQIVLVGDFFQLPPVYKQDERDGQAPQFAFESPIWPTLNLTNVQLTEIVRQSDPKFHEILMEARQGNLSDKSIQTLMDCQTDKWQELKIRPTLLFSRKAEVEMINEMNLKALTSPSKIYEATTIFDSTMERQYTQSSPESQRAIQKLDVNAPYKTRLELRVGSQVMLIFNMDTEHGLVNGSRGIVEGFTDTVPSYPLVLFKGKSVAIPVSPCSWESEDIEGLKRAQIPLILAYAVTIHRCQGATLDSALIDIGPSTFEVGQAYVALSRVKSLDSLYIYDLDPKAFKTHKKVKEFYDSLI